MNDICSNENYLVHADIPKRFFYNDLAYCNGIYGAVEDKSGHYSSRNRQIVSGRFGWRAGVFLCNSDSVGGHRVASCCLELSSGVS